MNTKYKVMAIASACAAIFSAWVLYRNQEFASSEMVGYAPTVAVAKSRIATVSDSSSYVGEFRPFEEVELHPKVAGYLKEIDVDVGDRVTKGEPLALLEVPELDAELTKAKAEVEAKQNDVKRFAADREAAQLTFGRLTQVSAKDSHLVAKQELDAARTKAAAASAAHQSALQQVAQAQAEELRTETLVDYSRISSPFDGTITKRYADPGALIQAGATSGTQATPLVHIVQNNKLRFTFYAPESIANRIHIGQQVRITAQFLTCPISVRVSRLSDNIDRETRTMEVEADVASPDRLIIPGSYGSVQLELERHQDVVTVPEEALTGLQGSVFIVGTDNKLEERKVEVGLSDGRVAEIRSGVKPGDLVVVGRKNRLVNSEQVVPKEVQARIDG